MGVDISLQTEDGKVLDTVGDPANILQHLLPTQPNDQIKLLGYVDWYGDTIFNRGQMKAILADLDQLSKNAVDPEHAHLLKRIKQLAERCSAEPHLYLRFRGD